MAGEAPPRHVIHGNLRIRRAPSADPSLRAHSQRASDTMGILEEAASLGGASPAIGTADLLRGRHAATLTAAARRMPDAAAVFPATISNLHGPDVLPCMDEQHVRECLARARYCKQLA